MIPLRDFLPTQRVPWATRALIAANLLLYGFHRSQVQTAADAQELALAWGLVPNRVWSAPIEAVQHFLTSLFTHDPSSVLHVATNMLFLGIFGDNVEDALGSLRFLRLYFLCALAAAMAQLAVSPGSAIPMIGASGAISGILAAYAVLHPQSPIRVLNPIPLLWLFWGFFWVLPAWVVIGEYFVVNLIHGLVSLPTAGAQGGTAFFAHLGGFVTGFLWMKRTPVRKVSARPDWMLRGYRHSRGSDK